MTNIEELTNQLSAMATDQQEGVLRSYSNSPPSHYCLRVEAFSLLTEQSVDGYETEVFEPGGYNWKLVFYPNGNKKRDVTDHISLYLELAGENSLKSDCEIYVDFRFFLLDQKKCKYLVVEDAFAKEICFHRVMLRSPRFDKLMPLKQFTDASNGFLIEDTCVIGAEVFVCKEKALGKREHLSKINNAFMSKHVWNVNKFSKLTGKCYGSKPFSAGDQKLSVSIPREFHCSIYIKLVDRKPIPPVSKLFVSFTLRIVDQKHVKDKSVTAKRCFSVESPSWSWSQFISLKILEEEKGLLKNDTCILEAEVIVHGVSKVL